MTSTGFSSIFQYTVKTTQTPQEHDPNAQVEGTVVGAPDVLGGSAGAKQPSSAWKTPAPSGRTAKTVAEAAWSWSALVVRTSLLEYCYTALRLSLA